MPLRRTFLWAAALGCLGLGCGGSSEISAESLIGSDAEPIVNGTPATSYPEAALVDMNGYACSGALIAPRVVLTAGHCVTGMTTWKITLPFARNQKATAVGAVVYDYDSTSDYVDPDLHDIGLVFLGTSLSLDTWPVIPQAKLPDGSKAIDIGRIQDGKLSNSALFQSQPIKLSDATREGFPHDYISTEVIESGDSGGPVVTAGSSPHEIVAVNSGGGSGTEVLARTDLLYRWIDEQVRVHGGWGTNGSSSSGGSTSSSSGASGSSGGAAIDGKARYESRCSRCHGTLATSDILGKTAADILKRHGSSVSAAEADAIAGILGGGSSSGGSSSGGTSSGGASSGGASSGGSTTPEGCTPEVEPNDDFRRAARLGPSACGSLSTSDVFDWYTWSIDGSKPYALNLTATGDASLHMWKLVNGQYYRVANTTDTTFEHTSTGPGTYVVLVLSFGASTQTYRLTLTGEGASNGSSSGGAPSPGSSSGGSASGGAALDGAALYKAKCSSCHRSLTSSTMRGRTAAQILGKHPSMVTSAEAAAIAAALK